MPPRFVSIRQVGLMKKIQKVFMIAENGADENLVTESIIIQYLYYIKLLEFTRV